MGRRIRFKCFFLNVINDLHPAIQFTHEKDKRALLFLAITVIKHNDNSIYTDVFYKLPMRTDIFILRVNTLDKLNIYSGKTSSQNHI